MQTIRSLLLGKHPMHEMMEGHLGCQLRDGTGIAPVP